MMSGERPITAASSGNTTFFLYGRGPIGEKTTTWNYSLLDGTNTPRQLTAANGDVTLSTRYTPWGDTLELNGTGNFTFGYIGGILDVATGLLYVGNGQYYDPTTGRFLTRDVNPDSPTPYVPWNPIGAILGPLGVLSMVAMRRRGKGNKHEPYLFLFIMLVVLPLSVGMACIETGTPAQTQPPTQPVSLTATETPPATATNIIPYATQPPTDPLTGPCENCPSTSTPTPTGTPTPTPSDSSIAQWLKDMFGVELLNGSDDPKDVESIWNEYRTEGARRAVEDVANKLHRVTGKDRSIAFRDAFSTYGENLVMKKVKSFTTIDGTTVTGGGYTNGPHLIHFAWIDYPRPDSLRNNIVHEMGHAFNQGRGFGPELGLPTNYPADRNLFLHNNTDPGVMWQANDAPTTSETFGDMFVAYTYDVWGDWSNPNNQRELRRHNPDASTWNPPQWMDDYMRAWLR